MQHSANTTEAHAPPGRIAFSDSGHAQILDNAQARRLQALRYRSCSASRG